MLGHMTSSANGKLYTIKINKYFLMRLLKRGALSCMLKSCINIHVFILYYLQEPYINKIPIKDSLSFFIIYTYLL